MDFSTCNQSNHCQGPTVSMAVCVKVKADAMMLQCDVASDSAMVASVKTGILVSDMALHKIHKPYMYKYKSKSAKMLNTVIYTSTY